MPDHDESCTCIECWTSPDAPTHPEPRPDDGGRQRIKVAWSALEQAYLDGAESREWIRRSTALWREIDRALTSHPAPQPVRDAAVFPVCGCGGEIATMREMAELPPSEDRWCICLDPAPLGATRSMTPEEVESQKQFRRSISRPLGATDEGKCVTCGKAADEHENVLGRLFCYPFTAETSGEDSCATFTTAWATDEGLRERVELEIHNLSTASRAAGEHWGRNHGEESPYWTARVEKAKAALRAALQAETDR